MANQKQKKGPNHHFIESWSMGMNDYEIARALGVDLNTVRSVKKDLSQSNNPVQESQNEHFPDQSPK